MDTVKLRNGVEMPILGYGVYQVSPSECERCVRDAISVGYRLIDTAQAYGNEQNVGNAIRNCSVPREELFIVTKVWISNAGYERAKASIDESLRKLQTDYIDLLLIHQPFNDYYGTWRAMEEAYKAGKLRAIGVANFYSDRFIGLGGFREVTPLVKQGGNPGVHQPIKAQQILEQKGTNNMGWGTVSGGRQKLLGHRNLIAIGAKYNKSAAQTALRYLIQRGVIVIPKSVRKERMEQNFDVFDFTLSDEDMQRIRQLDLGHSLFFSHYDPQTVKWLCDYGKSK